MSTLKELVSEDRVNAALRSFLEKYRDAGPYPTSLDLYRELQAATPDSMKYLLVDLFEHITLTVSRKPESVGVDPYHNLIQRVKDGKVVALEELGTTPWTDAYRARHYDSTRVQIPLPNF